MQIFPVALKFFEILPLRLEKECHGGHTPRAEQAGRSRPQQLDQSSPQTKLPAQ